MSFLHPFFFQNSSPQILYWLWCFVLPRKAVVQHFPPKTVRLCKNTSVWVTNYIEVWYHMSSVLISAASLIDQALFCGYLLLLEESFNLLLKYALFKDKQHMLITQLKPIAFMSLYYCGMTTCFACHFFIISSDPSDKVL